MRDILTGIAIILIVILTTMLVAPYFVDWNGQRAFLETKLSAALGQKVTVGGNIDLKLLPTPYLKLDQVVVGSDDGPARIGVRQLNLELSVTPLLHGEFDIVEARLREPTIRIALDSDRAFPTLPKAPAFSADVRFDRIHVSNGTLAVADPVSGRTFVFDHLDLDADAGSFAGPFKIVGAGGPSKRRTRFRLSTGDAQNGRTHLKLVVDETREHAGLDIDGTLDVGEAGDAARQSFDGSLALGGHLSQSTDASIGWKLSGPFKLDRKRGTLAAGELRLGNEDSGLTLQADAALDLAETPKLALALKAKQLDIDRLAGPPTEAGKPPPPPKLPDLATLRRMLAAATPPIQTGIDLSVETATYGGDTLSGIEAHLGLGDPAAQPLKITVDGPGGAHIGADGKLATTASPGFVGTVDLAADNLPRAADWLAGVAPSFAWTGGDMPFKTVKLAGRLEVTAGGIDGQGLALTLDRSVLNGKASLVAGRGNHLGKLTADLTAEALDLDALPSLDTLRGGATPLDLDIRLDAKAVKVSRVGDGVLDTGHIRLDLAKTAGTFDLRKLQLDDLGGASIQGTGHLDPRGGRLALTLDASRLDAAAGLLRRLVPGAATDVLVARAPALAPAKLKIDVGLTALADGRLTPNALTLSGRLGKTKVEAKTLPDSAGGNATSINATLDAPEGDALLRQLGLPAIPIETIGGSRIDFSARGRWGTPLDTKLTADFGATKLDISGRFTLESAAPQGAGKLSLKSPDLTPLLQGLAIAFPDLTGRVPADVTGDIALDATSWRFGDLKGRFAGIGARGALSWRRDAGEQPALTGQLDLDRLALSSLLALALGHGELGGDPASGGNVWSRQPFAVGLIDPPRVRLKLGVKTLDVLPGIEAGKASLELGIGPNIVTLDKVAADVLDGRVMGGVTVRRDGRQATLEGRITLDRAAIHVPGTLDTRLDAHCDLAGSGTSAETLVSSLAGTGDATTTGLSIPGGDPKALAKIFADVESDAVAADQDAVVHAFDEAAKGPLLTRSRHFGLTLAAGTLHFVPKDPDAQTNGVENAESVSAKIGASLDLTHFRLEERVEETLKALPANWSGAPPVIVMTLDGPIGRPRRGLDMSGFLNAVTSRALAREAARIEAYNLDVRERALYNARLQFQQRREEEHQKAEDDARKEADRKARLEAARRERKEAAAKAARDKARQDADKAREDADKAKQDADKAPPPPAPNAPDGGQRPQAPTDGRPAQSAPDPSAGGPY